MELTKAYWRRPAAAVGVCAMAVAAVLMMGGSAGAAIVPAVPLGTLPNYSVLGASAVSNTGPSVLASSVGLSPGSAVTGFPPGLVTPPGTFDVTNAAAAQAQSDLTAAYVDAANRSVSATTTADLGNQNLGAGVYATSGNGALQLTGPLVLDGAGDPSSVFVFQTDSSLTTASSSTVSLINGAQECNVFWQIGSSATLGTASTFAGNILAEDSVTVTTGVTVHGRAFARTGAVTLDTDTFVDPSCDTVPATTTTSTVPATSSTVPTPSTAPTPGSGSSTGSPSGESSETGSTDTGAGDTATATATDTGRLAETGVPVGVLVAVAFTMIVVGASAVWFCRNAP